MVHTPPGGMHAPPADMHGGGRFHGGPYGTLPDRAFTGGPGDNYTTPANATPHIDNPLGVPLPQAMVTPWAPSGITQPWPHDE